MKSRVKDMLDMIDWRISYKCDNRCLYCFGTKSNIHEEIKSDEIVLSKLIESEVKVINLTGGEPMLDDKRCLHIIDELFNSSKTIYLSTNGCNFIENYDYLTSHISFLGLPLDGYDTQTNSLTGRCSKSFAEVTKIFELCNRTSVKIKVGTVITHKNYHYGLLKKIARLLDNYDIAIWRLYEVLPENRALVNWTEIKMHQEEKVLVKREINEIISEKHSYKIEYVNREMRDSNYLIIEPDGNAIIPVDCGDRVLEKQIGSLILESVYDLQIKRDNEYGNQDPTYPLERVSDIGGGELL